MTQIKLDHTGLIEEGTIHFDGCEEKGISDFSSKKLVIDLFAKWEEGITFYKVIGLWDWVIDNCPDKHIVHLIKYGKNNRIKRKNFWRGFRSIGKELNK